MQRTHPAEEIEYDAASVLAANTDIEEYFARRLHTTHSHLRVCWDARQPQCRGSADEEERRSHANTTRSR